MGLDINLKKLKKNAFRYSKVRGETASRVRIPGGVIDAKAMVRVTEIAEESGFSSRSAFYRNFKDITGLSPAEWKRAARESRP